MRIHLITVGVRVPEWIRAGVEEYRRRMPPECTLLPADVAPGPRRRGDTDARRALQCEGERMLAAVPNGCRVWLLDEHGTHWSTAQLAQRLATWLQDGRDMALLVGGPDGIAPACRERAEGRWSLSRLTLPHLLVRVVVAEQIYRAWTVLRHHPYHRE